MTPSKGRLPEALRQRLLDKIEAQPSGCWHFTGRIHRKGYGQIDADGRTLGAHRVAYELLVGPIPDGMVIDHTCHNRDSVCNEGVRCHHRRCCNPDHLTPVTNRANILRGKGVAARHAAATHCIRGHEFTPENTYRRPSNGTRMCRACDRIYKNQRKAA